MSSLLLVGVKCGTRTTNHVVHCAIDETGISVPAARVQPCEGTGSHCNTLLVRTWNGLDITAHPEVVCDACTLRSHLEHRCTLCVPSPAVGICFLLQLLVTHQL